MRSSDSEMRTFSYIEEHGNRMQKFILPDEIPIDPVETVNGGENMYRRGGVKLHQGLRR